MKITLVFDLDTSLDESDVDEFLENFKEKIEESLLLEEGEQIIRAHWLVTSELDDLFKQSVERSTGKDESGT